MDITKKRNSFYCGALLWFVTAINCFTSAVPIFKLGNNTFLGYVSLVASILFFINGYKTNKQVQ